MKEPDALQAENTPSNGDVDEHVVRSIAEAVSGLDYGSVTITIHAAKVVQLDVTRKTRFS